MFGVCEEYEILARKVFLPFWLNVLSNIHQFYFLQTTQVKLSFIGPPEFAAQFLFVSLVLFCLFFFFSWLGPKDSYQLGRSLYVLAYRYVLFLEQFAKCKVVLVALKYAL